MLELALAVAAAIAAGDTASFQVRHELSIQVPEGAKELRVWMALPQEDAHQKVKGLKIEAPGSHRTTIDSEGNRVLYVEARAPFEPALAIVTTFQVERSEARADVDPEATRALTEEERKAQAAFLGPNQHVVIDEPVRRLADEIAAGETNPTVVSRRIYDWVLANVEYWVKEPATKKASPVGSSEYCMSTRTGNCTDFHSLYAALSRAEGIPTRLVYGSLFKPDLDGQDTDASYHCWIEYWAPKVGWVPLDVAVADIFDGPIAITAENETLVKRTTASGYQGPDAKLVEYYFGKLEPRRVTWSSGRDLVLDPKPAAGPVNALAKAWVEVDGKPLAEKVGWTRKMTYREVK